MGKLVAYFSATGTTRRKATELAKVAGADVHEIVPVERYTAADLDWHDKRSRSSVEMADASSRPQIVGPMCDLSAYDTVYLGFPIWWGVAPRVVETFVDANDLAGKKVVLFATSGGSGIGQAAKALKAAYPALDIVASKLLNGAVAEDII